jgi:hypothetical protein
VKLAINVASVLAFVAFVVGAGVSINLPPV